MRRPLQLFTCLSISVFLFAACGGSSDNNGKNGNGGKDDNGDKGRSYENMKEMNLSEYGVEAVIHVPKKDPDKNIRPAQAKPSNRGGVTVSAGKRFNMNVMQAPPAQDMKAKKKDIKNMSGALELTFVKEKDSLLLYKKSVPTGDKEMFEFYLIHEAGGKPFVIETGKGEFTKKDIDRMLKSARSIRPKKSDKAA